MVPALTKGGRSFKGAAAYYLHDKRREGEAERLSSDRVAWTQTLNLLTEDPERAWRMMATTAMKAEELKAAAGVKATGRKLTSPVHAFSLSWHPDEKPSAAEMMRAAQESLRAQGLDEHQALIVCHNDEPHAHVHVVVNRVHPATGKAATLSKSKLVLSQWAEAYERERGQILCPKRAENNEKRRNGEAVNEPRVPRNQHEQKEKTKASNDNLRAEFVRTDQKQRDAALSERGRKMHEAHRQQWAALKEAYAKGRKDIFANSDIRRQQVAAAVKDAFRPQWSELFKRQRKEEGAFSYRELTFWGRMQNIADHIKAAGWQDGTARQILGAVFNVSSGQRIQAFRQGQEQERKDLSRTATASTAGAVAAVREETRADLDQLRDSYLAGCETLKTQQDQQRGELRDAWRERNVERQAAFASLSEQGADRWSDVDATMKRAGDQAQGLGLNISQGRGFTPG